MATEDPRAAFDRVVRRWLEYRADAGRALKAVLDAAPELPMAVVLQAAFLMLVGSSATRPRASALATRARELATDPAGRAHAEAVLAWSQGDLPSARARWDDALDHDPHDLLALRLQHLSLFWEGDGPGMRAAIERRLPAWREADPGFGFVQGMHAFALEETGEPARAEAIGREAVLREPDDLWSVHAVAHVLDTDQRAAEGAAWLEPQLGNLVDRNPFRGHVAWHAALFAIEEGRLEEVLAAYDSRIRPGEEGFYLDVQNAASLLMRLELLGVDVGGRWAELADRAAPRVADLALPFTDLHVVLAQARAGRAEALARELDALEHAPDPVRRELLVPIARALEAFTAGRHGETVDLLLPLRTRWAPIGGSRTQRDLLLQILLVAALRAGRLDTARTLLAERRAERPRSRLADAVTAALDPADTRRRPGSPAAG